MIEKYESENSMMKYQIIFLKLQNFLYRLDKLTRRHRARSQAFFFDALIRRALIVKLQPSRQLLGARKAGICFSRLHQALRLVGMKR